MATDAIFLETTEGRILECNTVEAKMFGYAKEEIIGLTIADLVPEEFAKILPKVIIEEEGKRLTQKGLDGFLEYTTIRKKKDGTLFPLIISASPVMIDKKPQGTIVLYKDINERKQANS